MADQHITEQLAHHELFASFSPAQLDELCAHITTVRFLPKQVILSQDSITQHAFIIQSGLVRVYRTNNQGEPIHLAILGDASVIGELSLIDSLPTSATVEAVRPTVAIKIPVAAFQDALKKYPELSYHLLLLISKKLRTTDNYLQSFRTDTLQDRTLKTIMMLSKHYQDGIIPMSHEELAEIVGASRARVSEAVEQLVKQGVLLQRNRQLIIQMDRLPPTQL